MLTTQVNVPEGGIAFTNTYSASGTLDGAANLGVTKTLTGREWGNSEKFTFKMELVSALNNDGPIAADAVNLPGDLEIGKPATGGTNSGSFSSITYTVPGTYVYQVYEVAGAADLTYSDARYQVTVQVTDNGDGTLSAAASTKAMVWDEESGSYVPCDPPQGVDSVSMDFVNTYEPKHDTKTASTGGEDAAGDGEMAGVGEQITYTINWVNDALNADGTNAEAEVTITDVVPANTQLVEGSIIGGGELAADGTTITWDLGAQPAGATGSVGFSVTVLASAAGTSVENQAEVKVGNNPKTTTKVTTTVPHKDETTDPSQIKAGDVLTFTVTFTNAGAEAMSATVVDALDAGLQYVSGATVAIDGGDALSFEPSVDVDSNVLTWYIEDVPAGAAVVVTFDVTVTEEALTVVSNRATVNGHSTNVTTTPYIDDDKTVAWNGVDVDGSLVSVGAVLDYTINWSNTAVADGATVTVVDELPQGLEVVEGTISNNGQLSEDGRRITWTFDGLKVGARGVVTYQATVTDDAVVDGKVNGLTNTASINGVVHTATVYVPSKTAANDDATAASIRVGDTITYTIAYKNTEADAATVTITDAVPAGTELVAGSISDGGAQNESGTIVWTLEGVEPGAQGTVSFKVRVTEAALGNNGISNQATIKIGENGPTVDTNTETSQIDTGSVAFSKEVVNAAGSTGSNSNAFTFTVTLRDAQGASLAGSYAYAVTDSISGNPVNDGEGNPVGGTVANGSSIALAGGQTATIVGLPEGAQVTVAETNLPAGFTQTAPLDNSHNATAGTATVVANSLTTIAFTNTYTVSPIRFDPASASGAITKVVEGGTLAEGAYSFNLAVTPDDGCTSGASQTKTNAADGTVAFDEIVFSRVGTYTVTITEVKPTGNDVNTGMVYDTHTYTFQVTVSDNGAGQLVAAVAEGSVSGSPVFTNFVPEKTVNASSGVQVGDVLTYTISYLNNTGDTARIVIEDELTSGLTYQGVPEGADEPVVEGQKLTWTLEGVAAGAKGTVTFYALVNEGAAQTIQNSAYVKVGNNPSVETVPVESTVDYGSLEISKTVVVPEDSGLTINANKDFTFTVELADQNGSALAGWYAYAVYDAAGNVVFNDVVCNGGTITLKHDQRAVIANLPGGTQYTVTESLVSGYTPDPAEKSGTLTVSADATTASAAFTNTYGTTDVTLASGTLSGTKTYTNGYLTEDLFSFELIPYGEDTTAAVSAGTVVLPGGGQTATVGNVVDEYGNGTFSFGDITFKKVGEYTFVLKEGGSTLTGITFDPTQYTITVGVEDNGDGSLSAAVTQTITNSGDGFDPVETAGVPQGGFAFTNVYGKDASQSLTISGSKVLDGRALSDGEFTFGLYKDGNLETPISLATNKDGVFSFETLNFTMADLAGLTPDESGLRSTTITYTVKEMAGTAAGITYDGTYYEIAVTLSDTVDEQGVLNGGLALDAVVTRVAPDGTRTECSDGMSGITFKNIYTATAIAPIQIEGTKTVEGWEAGTDLTGFSFEVKQVVTTDDSISRVDVGTAVTDETGTIGFSLNYVARSFTGAAAYDESTGYRYETFTYEVSEINDGRFGVRYDTSIQTVYVKLWDDGQGNLWADVDYGYDNDGNPLTGVSFTNVYDVSSIQFTPAGTKQTLAAEMTKLEGVSFGFVVKDAGGNVVSEGTSSANGAIAFKPFAVPDEGEFVYTISEVNGGGYNGAITYDTTTYTLTLVVERTGNGEYSFTPTYTNEVTGEQVAEGAVFCNTYDGGITSIDLSATKTIEGPHALDGFLFNVTDVETSDVVAVGTSDENGNVAFSSIVYSYTGIVPDEPGAGDDATGGDSDNGDEQPDGDKGDGSDPDATDPEVTDPDGGNGDEQNPDNEEITGPEGGNPSGDEATDTTDPDDSNSDATDPDDVVEGSDGGNGDGADTDATDPSDMGGNSGDGDGDGTTTGGEGIDGDDATDNPDGGIATSSLIDGETTPGVASDAAEMLVDALTPGTAIADDEDVEPFQVETISTDPAADDEPSGPTAGVSSSDLGSHWYRIAEINDGKAGVTYDETTYLVEVIVEDARDENGILLGTIRAFVAQVVEVSPDGTQTPRNGLEDVVFRNSYKADQPVSVTIEGTKALTGRDAADAEFSFKVLDVQGNTIAGGQSVASAAGEAAAIRFGTFSLTEAGSYDFTVVENGAGTTSVTGVTYDDAVFSVHVEVTDNGDGTLSAEVSYPDGPVAFSNAYKALGEISVELAATKTLTGRAMDAGEFSFQVADANGTVVAGGTSRAAADGEAAAIDLAKLYFSEPGVYTFTVSELKGGTVERGVAYDDAVFSVSVEVVDNLDGTLSAQVDYPEGGIAFANAYSTEGQTACVTPVATKTLTGRELTAGAFTFTVKDPATGEVVSTGTNGADGAVAFGAIAFDAPGTYEYVVNEVAGREDGMTYDLNTFRLVVTVVDNLDGTLSAQAAYPDGVPAFANVYQAPPAPVEPERPSVPKTGDATPSTAALALAGAGMLAAGLGGAFALRCARREA